jgi:hypothetical protein
VLSLASCGAQFHLNKAKKHTEKAIKKGAVINAVTDTVYISDTLIETKVYTVNDTTYIETIKTVDKIIEKSGEIRYITKRDKRAEERLAKKSQNLQFKLDKLKLKYDKQVAIVSNRQANKTERKSNKKNLWWLWMLVGVGLCLLAKLVTRKVKTIAFIENK